jgi:hypothetical protein
VLKFPSKTFVLGEYAILQGSTALLMGSGPWFTASYEPGAAAAPFHPESPAGKWLSANPTEARIQFGDPHQGKGGFGGSGAEFLAAWCFEKTVPPSTHPRAIFAWSAWEDSRLAPAAASSGADILTQAFGVNRADAYFLEIDPVGHTLKEIFARKHQGEISLFHTGKKMPTHEAPIPAHLPLEEMENMVIHAGEWLERGHFEGFAKELNAYGAKLAELGLVAPHTAAALRGLERSDQVLGAKGCGAMGSDVILVAHRGANLTAWAQENSLTLTGTYPV